MDILSTIYALAQEYELKRIQSLSDDKQEIFLLNRELQNIRDNISCYVDKLYPTVSKEVQDILDHICVLVGVKNNYKLFLKKC